MLVTKIDGLSYLKFDPSSKDQFTQISEIIAQHLLEPYSIYVYWYFLNKWPQYCFIVKDELVDQDKIIGVIISKCEPHNNVRIRGYIGMLVIDPTYRNRKIASNLVNLSIEKMIEYDNIDEIMLETEVINLGALKLYESLGFMRTKRLYRYYLNTHDAFRLILPILDKSGCRLAFLSPLSV